MILLTPARELLAASQNVWLFNMDAVSGSNQFLLPEGVVA